MIKTEMPAKTESEKFRQGLNLFNFESDEAIYSPYILTSPRSLKACRLANIKPIELLHRSVDEIAADLNLDKCQVNHIYLDYEQERLKKLEICKIIRRHILTSEHLNRSESVSHTRHSHAENSSKSVTRPVKDNALDLPPSTSVGTQRVVNSYSVPTTPLIQYNSLKRQKNKLLSFGLSNSNSMLSLNSDSTDCTHQHRSKSVENKYSHTNVKKPLKKYIFNSKKKKNDKKNHNKHSNKNGTQVDDRQLCWEIDKTKKSENEIINKKIQADDRNKKRSKEKKNFVAKQTTDENNFVKNCENFVHTASKIGKIQPKEPKLKIKIKKCDYECQSESKPSQKKDKAKNLKTNSDKIHLDTNADSNVKNEDVMEIRSHDARILDAMVLKKEKQETLDNLANRANLIWGISREKTDNNHFHQPGSKTLKSNNCVYSDNFALDTYFQQIKNRIKQLKENCLYKELHSEHVRQLARELQIGMEQWQDQVLLLQWRALQRAQTNARLLRENKRLKTQSENKERTLMHALRFRNLQQLEQIKQQIMKKEIEEKDDRIERLKIKREQEILNCRAQAHYTAELREQLRHTLTPETFDRKVSEVLVKSKFTNRLLTTNPFIESKIRLG